MVPRPIAPRDVVCWAGALGLLALACAPAEHGARVRRELDAFARARRALPVEREGYTDLRGAIHLPRGAGQAGSFEEILAGARRARLDFLVLPAQRTALGASAAAPPLVLPSLEIARRCRGERCARLLAIGVEEPIDPALLDLQEAVDEVNRLGGLAFVVHARDWRDWSVEGLAGLEVYDVPDRPRNWADWLPFRAQRAFWLPERPDWHLRRWDELLRAERLVGVAVSRAEAQLAAPEQRIDALALGLRRASTHVWAWSGEREAILSALAGGHAYVALEALADASGFWFGATAPGRFALQGDSVSLAPELALRVEAPLAGRIVVLHDGAPLAQCECSELSLTAERPGVYRAEVQLSVQGRWRPWILSNPIRVR